MCSIGGGGGGGERVVVVQFERKGAFGGMFEYVACMSGYGILVCVYWYNEKRL